MNGQRLTPTQHLLLLTQGTQNTLEQYYMSLLCQEEQTWTDYKNSRDPRERRRLTRQSNEIHERAEHVLTKLQVL